MAEEFFKKEPRQSRSRALVAALIQSAEQLLERTGDLTSVSAEGVARRAGVGIGSLYDYFANGDGVLGALLQKLTAQNFDELKREVEATRGLKMPEAIRRVSEAIAQTYLSKPNRTRGAMFAIARLGWMMPVIKERDRFAEVLAARVLESAPNLERAKAEAACRTLSDAVMGIIAAQVWRPTPDPTGVIYNVACGTLEYELGIDLSKY
jgi:AcrR family transcriptional regulator